MHIDLLLSEMKREVRCTGGFPLLRRRGCKTECAIEAQHLLRPGRGNGDVIEGGDAHDGGVSIRQRLRARAAVAASAMARVGTQTQSSSLFSTFQPRAEKNAAPIGETWIGRTGKKNRSSENGAKKA